MPSPKRLTAEHLTTIRHTTDWRQLFTTLRITKDPKKSRDHDWWGKSPFKPDERTASFHINDQGWYCHATNQGGGAIELVQHLHNGLSCYEAGRWLLEHGVSSIVSDLRTEVEAIAASPDQVEFSANQPIRQDLRQQLDPHHPCCTERGIPPNTLQELGAGYLDRPPRKNGRPDPLNRRIVFQIRGMQEDDDGQFQPTILSHTGRATTQEQAERDGKWWTYPGFRKSLELYNLDLALLDDTTVEQARGTHHVIIVEGVFDVARLYAAGIRNVVATFGAHLSARQLHRLEFIAERIGVNRFLFFYDRDDAGSSGATKALELVANSDLELSAAAFDWNRTWKSPQRGEVRIPETITDPAEFSVEQLRWLRQTGCI